MIGTPPRPAATPSPTSPPAHEVPGAGLDLLALPALGALLRWRPLRLVLQSLLLLVSLALVLHGWLGPQLAPRNLATLVTWVHYRGLLVAVLLLAGNLFCMACPFVLPRELARRLVPRRLRPPAWLRTKWPAVALFAGVLFVYEWLDLWASPWGTAWLIALYFALALLVDTLFEGATFCKAVCPVGQFNFLGSTLSPLEIGVRDRAVCERCTGHECLTGRHDPSGRLEQRGCELGLFLPRKQGNLDCTFCLDCVHACPEDNVALHVRAPGEELASGASGAGVGRLDSRPDLAALAGLFAFGALLNAFAMVSPVYAVQRTLADWLGTQSEVAVLAVLFAIGLVIEPLVLLGAAAWASRRLSGAREPLLAVAMRYVWSLVPLGFGVWLAHYAFHLLTGLWTIVPVVQKTAVELGVTWLGEPAWGMGGLRAEVVQPIEYGFVMLGTLGSCLVARRLARRHAPARAGAVAAPWTALSLLLGAAALWLLSQPMEMRGTFLG